MELPTPIGLSCPICHHAIPLERLRSPWCDCGWRRRRTRLPWLLAGAAALLVSAGLWLALRAPVRSGTGTEGPGPDPGSARAVAMPLAEQSARGEPARPGQRAPAVASPAAAGTARPGPSAAELLALARKLASSGALKEAAGMYRKVLQLDPRLVEAHLELGLLCSDLKDYQCANSELARALELQPQNTEILEHMAGVFRDSGQIGQAVDAYRKLVGLRRLDPGPALELAHTLDDAGRAGDAVVAYQDYLNRFPDDPGAAGARRRLEDLTLPEDDRPPAYEVAIERSGSAILVEGQVEDATEVRFLLDTGSTLTIISSELAEELGFDLRAANYRMVRLQTANGPVEAPMVTLESLTLGKVVARDVQAAIYDIRAADEIDGLLGLSFLDRFRFTIDASGKVMHLEPRQRSSD